MNQECREFAGKPYVLGWIGLYFVIAVGYLVGSLGVGLLLLLVVGHLMGQLDIAALRETTGVSRLMPWLCGVCAVVLLVSARVAQRAIQGAGHMSIRLDGCAIHIKDGRERSHVIRFDDVVGLRVDRPWLGIAPVYVLTKEGRHGLRLPSVKNREGLVKAILDAAGLVRRGQGGRRELYGRSEE